MPGHPAIWTAAVLAALAFPVYPLVLEALAGPRAPQPWRVFLRVLSEDMKTALAQASLQLTFLANQAYAMAHAILVTLVRLVVTRRRLLQWETAAASAARSAGLAKRAGTRLFLVEMAASPSIALAGLVLVSLVRPDALSVAVPVLALWAAAPFVAYGLSRPVTPRRRELTPEDAQFLRGVARKTWRYFEAYMGPEDHGLPPDNFQETPEPRVAHRTSPTNIGMGLLATLAAHDLGFIRTDDLLQKIEATLTSLEGLERFEGHLLNWYDTTNLAPLPPRYVSTVDSGNLAGALLTLAEGLRQVSRSPQSAARVCQGIGDVAALLREALAVPPGRPRIRPDSLVRLAEEAAAVERILAGPEDAEARLAQLAARRDRLEAAIRALDAGPPGSPETDVVYWARRLHAGIAADTSPVIDLARRSESLARRAAAFADGMNFRFLYDPQRRILSIGYRLADAEGPGRLDLSYYDLLASEARLASFIAIAKGDLPETHWFHLGRLITSVDGMPTLLSWSATLFEYLMPLLVMRSYPDTLLDQTCRMVVRRQIEYATERGVPWGMSESAYNLVDLHDNYQYKAFGVPGLGLKRGLGDELVVAPYATALASMLEPARAARNFRRLAATGLDGAYGYYEAIDYTHGRIDEPGSTAKQADRAQGVVVRAFLAHHQGMTLVALSNALLGDLMVQRFHADPRVQATELLLQERVPRQAPIAQPRPVEETHVAAPTPSTAVRRFRSAHTLFPHAQFLSNGNYAAVVTNGGGGASLCRGRAVTRHRDDPTRDPGSQFIYLRDVRSGLVWSPTFQPMAWSRRTMS